jgi:hypothetical protein
MADQDHYKTNVRETRISQGSDSGTGTALIVGGLVVAVGIILWLALGNTDSVVTTEPASTDNTTITVEPSATPTEDGTTNNTIEPAPDSAAPDATTPDAAEPAAPADGAEPAPTDGTAPATPPANP